MAILFRYTKHSRALVVSCFLLLLSGTVWSQAAGSTNSPAAAPPIEAPKDVLGRGTPRGAVLGFITAARKDNIEVAALYLNTPLRGQDSQELARQLAAV